MATPVDDIMEVLARAAADIDFACHGAPERLLDLAVCGRCRRRVGCGCAGRALKCAPRRLAGRTIALRPKRGYCTAVRFWLTSSLALRL